MGGAGVWDGGVQPGRVEEGWSSSCSLWSAGASGGPGGGAGGGAGGGPGGGPDGPGGGRIFPPPSSLESVPVPEQSVSSSVSMPGHDEDDHPGTSRSSMESSGPDSESTDFVFLALASLVSSRQAEGVKRTPPWLASPDMATSQTLTLLRSKKSSTRDCKGRKAFSRFRSLLS